MPNKNNLLKRPRRQNIIHCESMKVNPLNIKLVLERDKSGLITLLSEEGCYVGIFVSTC